MPTLLRTAAACTTLPAPAELPVVVSAVLLAGLSLKFSLSACLPLLSSSAKLRFLLESFGFGSGAMGGKVDAYAAVLESACYGLRPGTRDPIDVVSADTDDVIFDLPGRSLHRVLQRRQCSLQDLKAKEPSQYLS
ncbi:MAG: hypothetical protein FRX49_10987 [Trebouxia sp. A1-2]|nr:MAG: hypothetical protein FRX49_10987 [Trebouxia sp. A1-2]